MTQVLNSNFASKIHALLCRKYLKDRDWLVKALNEKIDSIDWKSAIVDVERFIKVIEHKSLSMWSNRFFMSKLNKFKSPKVFFLHALRLKILKS